MDEGRCEYVYILCLYFDFRLDLGHVERHIIETPKSQIAQVKYSYYSAVAGFDSLSSTYATYLESMNSFTLNIFSP